MSDPQSGPAIHQTDLAADVERLSQVVAPSGAEDAMIATFDAGIRRLGFSPSVDPLGNVVVPVREQRPGVPHVMVSAHLDEIGVVVREVSDDGWLRLHGVGGISERVLAGQRLAFLGRDGALVEGVVGLKGAHITPAEERGRTVGLRDAYVDVLASARSEVDALGIEVGTLGTFVGPVARRGDLLRGKAMDDRAGVAVLNEVARRCRSDPPEAAVTLVGTVQEEFTVRAGVTAARRVAPDLALCVDIAMAADVPDAPDRGPGLGSGAIVHRFTRGSSGGLVPNPRLVDLAAAAAGRRGVPLCFDTLSGGYTDGSFMQFEAAGIPTLDVCFAVRYAHTPVETVHLGDVRAVADLVMGIVEDAPRASLARGDTTTAGARTADRRGDGPG